MVRVQGEDSAKNKTNDASKSLSILKGALEPCQLLASPAIESTVGIHGRSKRKALEKSVARAQSGEHSDAQDSAEDYRRLSCSPSPVGRHDKVRLHSACIVEVFNNNPWIFCS